MLGKNGIRVGINGIGGRIGGNALRVMIKHPDLCFNVVAGNEIGLDPDNLGRNFTQAKAYDSTFGAWPCTMRGDGDKLWLRTNDGDHCVQLFAERDPSKIPWSQRGVVGVAECTGVFRTRASNGKPGYDSHLTAGAKRVALSAPAKDDVLTVVYGVHTTDLRTVKVCSAASCTSGSIAFPLRVVLNHKKKWGLTSGMIQTVHGYTSGEQGLQDRPDVIKPGSRRMFAAAVNIIPTTTGAAKAIPKVDGIGTDMQGIPFVGDAWRVPVISGSITHITVVLETEPALDDVIDALRQAANGPYTGKFALNEDPNESENGLPLVSSHIVRRPESSIADAEFCRKSGKSYMIPCWYGNEWGYVYRLVEALAEQCS